MLLNAVFSLSVCTVYELCVSKGKCPWPSRDLNQSNPVKHKMMSSTEHMTSDKWESQRWDNEIITQVRLFSRHHTINKTRAFMSQVLIIIYLALVYLLSISVSSVAHKSTLNFTCYKLRRLAIMLSCCNCFFFCFFLYNQ